jgi:UPF0716 protein FxsA
VLPLLLVVAFVVVPLLELYVIIQIGQVIGAWPTILLLLADSVLGSLLLRAQGRTVWRRFNAAVREGRVPHREILDGVLIIFGGALLLTPGFLTDVVGLLLLIPATRAAVRGGLARLLSRRVLLGVAGPTGAAAYGGGRRLWRLGQRRRRRRPADVEGTAREGSPAATGGDPYGPDEAGRRDGLPPAPRSEPSPPLER